jgi:hypothetical protein
MSKVQLQKARALLDENQAEEAVALMAPVLAEDLRPGLAVCSKVLAEWDNYAAQDLRPPMEIRLQSVFKLLELVSLQELRQEGLSAVEQQRARLSQQFEENLSKGNAKVIELRKKGSPDQKVRVLPELAKELTKYQRKYRLVRTTDEAGLASIAVWAAALLDIERFLKKQNNPTES